MSKRRHRLWQGAAKQKLFNGPRYGPSVLPKSFTIRPENAAYRIKLDQIRFEASQFHVKQGLKLKEKGDLQKAIARSFSAPTTIDPTNEAAEQKCGRR